MRKWIRLLLLRILHHVRVFGRFLVEILDAGLATEVHVGPVMGHFDGLPHFPKGFAGDYTFLERVRRRYIRRLSIGGRKATKSEEHAGEKC
jgi:hypothetical protein